MTICVITLCSYCTLCRLGIIEYTVNSAMSILTQILEIPAKYSPNHYTTHCTAVDLATQAAAKIMTSSKTCEAADNVSPNIVGSKKMMEKHAQLRL